MRSAWWMWLVLLPVSSDAAPVEELRFENLSLRHGLSQSTVLCMLQDRQGFMWFGTEEGLNRYDGYGFEVFKRGVGQGALGNDHIHCLLEDEDERLWVGTDGGLFRYEPEENRFRRDFWREEPSASLLQAPISALARGPHGRLWVGTPKGLAVVAPESGRIERPRFGDASTSLRNGIGALLPAPGGRMWVGTRAGLYLVDGSTAAVLEGTETLWISCLLAATDGRLWIGSRENGLHVYHAGTTRAFSLEDNGGAHIRALSRDRTGGLWIGTEHGGLHHWRPETGRLLSIRHRAHGIDGLSDDTVFSIYEDRSGVLWLGTKGIDKLVPGKNAFLHYRHDPSNAHGLSDGMVRALLQDRRGYLWVGTVHGGIDRFDPGRRRVTHFRRDPEPGGLNHNEVLCLFEDRSGGLWAGTNGGGLHRYLPEWERFEAVTAGVAGRTAPRKIRALGEDARGELWVGGENGLFRFDRAGDRPLRQPRMIASLNEGFIRIIYLGPSGRFWVGTDGGLFRQNGSLTFERTGSSKAGLSHDRVLALHEQEDGTLWIGTHHGLNRRSSEGGAFRVFLEKDGLPNNVIYGILADEHGGLWLSTNGGLCHFLPESGVYRNFDVRDGLQSDEFNAGSCFKGRDGEMFFGGINGFNAFYPASIQSNPHRATPVFTAFEVLGKPVAHGDLNLKGRPILDAAPVRARRIELTWRENILSCRLAALNYIVPEKNRYAYKMEGIDRDWVPLGTRNLISFNHLSPGDYRLRVKAANNDGLWNPKTADIRILITPPFWKTNLAKLLYFITILLILYAIRGFELNRERLRQDLQLQKIRSENLQETDRLKSRFFANISHELRTPLTLILGPLRRMRTPDYQGGTHKYLDMMIRNGERLLTLINQLLDLSKLDAGRMQLHAAENDVAAFLKVVCDAFEPLAERRGIDFRFENAIGPAPVYFDREKLEKVFFNLLSNAFKFCGDPGRVRLELEPSADGNTHVAVIVADNGRGVPEQHRRRIFDRFYQAGPGGQGSGIGLALARELVKLHHGEIVLLPGQNTRFRVVLPLGKAHLNPDQIEETDEGGVSLTPPSLEGAPDRDPVVAPLSAPLVLVVEDNPEVRAYIVEILSPDCGILEAGEGGQALELALKRIPDLIVSDVVMPGMDGFELCDRLKQDHRSSHIPIILLTAKAARASKLTGLQKGADAYVIKPFDGAELRARVHQLIEQRRKLRQRFSLLDLEPRSEPEPSMEARFLQKALAVAEQYLADAAFTVEDFASEMAMSRVQLYRKLHALTGQAPSLFIRELRLKRAARLLREKTGSVAEITFEVGFTDPSYFSKCFRKRFGKSPSEYA